MNVLEVLDRTRINNLNPKERAQALRSTVLKCEFSTEVAEIVLRVSELLPDGVPVTPENMRPYLYFVLEREKGYMNDEEVDAGFTIYAIRKAEILSKTP
jgi:hypothetical protein